MALVHELAACVEACFTLYAVQTDGLLLSRTEQAKLSEISSILQPVLLRLQKQAVAASESQELYAEDDKLLEAAVHLRRALKHLQAAAARCAVPHWLVRVLVAADARHGLQAALRELARALSELLEAEGSLGDEVSQLQAELAVYRVSPHESLERLGVGLYKHMECATDAEQVVKMLRFVIREAQNLSLRRKTASSSSRHSSSSGSRRDSDASDGSTSRAAGSDANNAAAGASIDASSDSSSSGSSSKQKNNGAKAAGGSSRAGSGGSKASSSSSGGSAQKPGDVPPGETSLTDVQLLLAVQQLADSMGDTTQQLVLHQVLSILEELHEAKAHQLKHKQMKRLAAAGGGAAAALSSVPEGGDDSLHMTIAAVRSASDLQALPPSGANGSQAQHRQQQQHQQANGSAPGQPATYGAAVASLSGGLEEMLWADPWDAAALTQLMELLLQAACEEEYVEPEAEKYADAGDDAPSSRGGDQAGKRGGGSGSKGGSGGRKWWGSVGKAAKAALGGSSRAGSGGGGAKSASTRSAAAEEEQARKRERLHKLVVAAVDVTLRLTARPAGFESCFAPASRPDLTPYRSLALPLMFHPDTAPALAACIWSSWNDAAIRAARVLATLVSSEPGAVSAGSVAAAASAAGCPEALYAAFVGKLGASGGASGSAWHGLITLLHNSNLSAAAGAAEALAAIGASSRSAELCTSLTATQAARALLLLLAKHQVHPAAAGAAAAALASLAHARLRPAMHELLVSSYTQGVPGASVPLGDTLVALMLGSDSLAACRAAGLAAALASGVDWAAAPTHPSGEPGSLWAETFRAGQHMLQRSRGSGSSSSGSSEASMPSLAGARLLAQLVAAGGRRQGGGEGGPQPAPASRSREDMCFEALLLAVQKLRGYDVPASKGASLEGREGRVTALLELVHAILGSTSEGRVCGVLPELHEGVVPVLQAITASKAAANNAALGEAASQLHELLMVLGG